MYRTHVYRPPPTFRPQYYRPKRYEDFTLRWLYNRATQQYVVASGGPYTSESLFYNQTPAVQAGFIGVVPLLTDQGNALTIDADGIMDIDAASSTARQSLTYDIYNTQTASFYGSAVAYINNTAPTFTTSEIVFAVERNQSITPFDISVYGTDADGDSLTWACSTSLPGTIALSSAGVGSGISPDANSITAMTGTLTDIAGDSAPWTATLIVGRVVVPDAETTHLSQTDAFGLISANYLTPALGTSVNSATVPVGSVVSTVPAHGNEAAPFSTVTVIVSLGPVGSAGVAQPIVDATYALNSVQSLDLTPYFTSPVTFAMTPSVGPSGETLVGAIFTPQTALDGTFGPFIFSANGGTAVLNEWRYTVTPAATAANPVRQIRFSGAPHSIKFSLAN